MYALFCIETSRKTIQNATRLIHSVAKVIEQYLDVVLVCQEYFQGDIEVGLQTLDCLMLCISNVLYSYRH